MKRYVVLGVVGTMLLSCCGCASMIMPELTASEFDKVAEYAAYTLLENTDGYESKLMSEEDVQRELEERKLAAEIEAALDAANKPGGSTGGNDDKPIINPDGTGENIGDTTGDVQVSDKTIADVLDLDGVTIEYSGCELVDAYPNDVDALFGMKAAEGKKLMVLSFVLSNTGSEQVECDLLAKDAIYRITVGDETYRSLLTVFDNDLSTWSAPLAPGSVNMAFLIFQVPAELEADGIGNIELSVRIDKTTRSIILR
ncbi:MAG: hypothetical protein J6B39_03535 [Lachnospiraceae bacterium]|nr:hypothetical protein [Lachnospiraceae bacterium]